MRQTRSIREQVFEDQDGGYVSRMALSTLPADLRQAYTAEVQAVNCNSCDDAECRFRHDRKRLPADAGGESQCLRWAKAFAPLAWRNPDGCTIILPQEIIDAIRAGA